MSSPVNLGFANRLRPNNVRRRRVTLGKRVTVTPRKLFMFCLALAGKITSGQEISESLATLPFKNPQALSNYNSKLQNINIRGKSLSLNMRATHVALIQKTEVAVQKATDFVYSERMNIANAICASRAKTVTVLGGTFGKNVTTTTQGNMAECIKAAQEITEKDIEIVQRAQDKALEQYAQGLSIQSRVNQLEAEREAQGGEAKKRAAEETNNISRLNKAKVAAEEAKLRLEAVVNEKEAKLKAAKNQSNANATRIKQLANAQASAKESAAAATNRIKQLEAALEESKKRKKLFTRLFTKGTNVVGGAANLASGGLGAGTALFGGVATTARFAGVAMGLGTLGFVAVSLYVFYVFTMGWARSMQMPSFFMFGKSNSLRVQQLARNHKSEIERLAGEHAAAITRLNRALEDERMRLEAEVASVKRELEELKRRRTYMTRSLMSRGATVRGSNSNNNSVTQVVRHGR